MFRLLTALALISSLARGQSPFGTPIPGQADTDRTEPVPRDSIDAIAGRFQPVFNDQRFQSMRSVSVEVGMGRISTHHKNLRAKCSEGGFGQLMRNLILARLGEPGTETYLLMVNTMTTSYMYIDQDPMVLVVDHNEIRLPAAGPPRRDVGTGWVTETQTYTATVPELREIGLARSAEGLITGRDGRCTFGLPVGSRMTVRQFLRDDSLAIAAVGH